jgi:hypothetical protein
MFLQQNINQARFYRHWRSRRVFANSACYLPACLFTSAPYTFWPECTAEPMFSNIYSSVAIREQQNLLFCWFAHRGFAYSRNYCLFAAPLCASAQINSQQPSSACMFVSVAICISCHTECTSTVLFASFRTGCFTCVQSPWRHSARYAIIVTKHNKNILTFIYH